jgi:ABC-type sulfate/molybdate transport systems ATPase subunit
MTVEDNVGYGIVGPHRGVEARRQVREVLERFGITALARARPVSLSGGERQRVALARTVASDPQALLLDEPMSALDPAARGEIAHELGRHVRTLRLPVILVSHDFGDVAGLADRIAVIEAGHIVQRGTPAELVQAPASPFVAALAGVNYFPGMAKSRGELTEVLSGPARFLSLDRATGPVGVVVYPWEVALSATAPTGSALNSLSGAVSRVVTVGNRVRVTVGSDPPIVAEVTEESAHRLGIRPGTPLVATWKAAGTKLAGTAAPASEVEPR